jgi:hypothetical protein
MKIKGIVYNKNGETELGAKVFISDYNGALTPKKIGTITNDNGKFELDVTDKDNIYLTAKNSIGEQTITKIKDNVFDYGLYMDEDRSQNLQEVTIIAKRPIKSNKWKWKWILIGIGGLLVVGTTIYFIKKNK